MQGWQKGGLNSEPSVISDLDEKVLPLYRQGPPNHFSIRLGIYDASVTGTAEQAGISLQRSQLVSSHFSRKVAGKSSNSLRLPV